LHSPNCPSEAAFSRWALSWLSLTLAGQPDMTHTNAPGVRQGPCPRKPVPAGIARTLHPSDSLLVALRASVALFGKS
jgi:hypothetical protein